MPEAIARLDRRLSELSGLSRRDASVAIRGGRVTLGGELERDPTARRAGDLALDGQPLVPPPRLALFHKPVGVHSTIRDDHGRPSLGTEAGELVALGLHPVGRLDADTDGLLLFSSDGALTQHLLHPRRALERIYLATVEGALHPGLADVLREGVQTSDGVFTARVISLEGDRVTLAVTEGKHRMVRRMLANAGHPVVGLRRLAYGPFRLDELPPGAWRPATAAELEALGTAAAVRRAGGPSP
jgi:23S rRNA pseudouridine2605 synthase